MILDKAISFLFNIKHFLDIPLCFKIQSEEISDAALKACRQAETL